MVLYFMWEKMNKTSKTGHIISNFHTRRERFASVVKITEFDIPEDNQQD